MSKRDYLKTVAEETVQVVKQGRYKNGEGKEVSIAEAVEFAVNNTKLYKPSETDNLLETFTSDNSFNTKFEVVNETTLEGVRRLVKEGCENVVALNFASAKNPGGGFLTGSQAQEESLARSSALYTSISTKQEMYNHNRNVRTALYSDYMIYSPKVPVFRRDNGDFLNQPYLLSFVTAPAVNAGVVLKQESPENQKQIALVMKKRVEKVLTVALENGHDTIVLGAFGCGVFKNKPNEVAALFRKTLRENQKFKNRFKRVVFSVLDKDRKQEIIRPFKYAFSQN